MFTFICDCLSSDTKSKTSNRPARCLAHLVGIKPNFQGFYCG